MSGQTSRGGGNALAGVGDDRDMKSVSAGSEGIKNMEEKWNNLFRALPEEKGPPPELYTQIMGCIGKAERKAALFRVLIFSASLACSFFAFVPAFRLFADGLTASGFMNFISLLFTDLGAVFSFSGSYVLTLLESLPVTGLLLLSFIAFIFLGSVRFLSRDVKIILAAGRLIKT